VIAVLALMAEVLAGYLLALLVLRSLTLLPGRLAGSPAGPCSSPAHGCSSPARCAGRRGVAHPGDAGFALVVSSQATDSPASESLSSGSS
jgi:hypothetical protein